MSRFAMLRSHDPYWETEGPAARREHRRAWLVTHAAFVASLVALLGAGAVWCIQLGVAAQLGITARLPFG